MANTHYGSCLCKEVRFEAQGKLESFFLCHCRHCQKGSGSAHSANLFSTGGKLIWLQGVDRVQTYNLPQTRHTKSFCQNCGSALPYQLTSTNLLVIPAGSLDTEVSRKPNAHIFCASSATWDNELESVQRFAKLPE